MGTGPSEPGNASVGRCRQRGRGRRGSWWKNAGVTAYRDVLSTLGCQLRFLCAGPPAPPQVVSVLKKEVMKTQNKEYDKAGEYRQMLVQVGKRTKQSQRNAVAAGLVLAGKPGRFLDLFNVACMRSVCW